MISKYFIEFIVYSFCGWIWECCYCTVRTHKWQNRGFLYGPIVPIYGTGAVAAMLIFGVLGRTYPFLDGAALPVWKLFLICAAASAVLEYLTSYALERIFHARWWDYSDMPLNVNGRICLPATTLFGVAGVLIVRYVLPMATRAESFLPDVLAELLALLLMALLAGDFVLTVDSLLKLSERIARFEGEFNAIMETGYQSLDEKQKALRELPREARLRIDAFADEMSTRQRYALRNIRRYSSKQRELMAERVKDAFEKLGERVSQNIEDMAKAAAAVADPERLTAIAGKKGSDEDGQKTNR